jgi:hypothetical protein
LLSRAALIFGLLQLAAATNGMAEPAPSDASEGTMQWVCLRHVGPEDKPMPKVCFTQLARPADAPHAAFSWWQVTPGTWPDLLDGISDAAQAQPPFEFGAYRVEGPEGWGSPVLPRQAVRKLLALLAPSAKPLSNALPEGLGLLKKRLGS